MSFHLFSGMAIIKSQVFAVEVIVPHTVGSGGFAGSGADVTGWCQLVAIAQFPNYPLIHSWGSWPWMGQSFFVTQSMGNLRNLHFSAASWEGEFMFMFIF